MNATWAQLPKTIDRDSSTKDVWVIGGVDVKQVLCSFLYLLMNKMCVSIINKILLAFCQVNLSDSKFRVGLHLQRQNEFITSSCEWCETHVCWHTDTIVIYCHRIKTFFSSNEHKRLQMERWISFVVNLRESVCEAAVLVTFWLFESCQLEGDGWRVPCVRWQFSRFQHRVDVWKTLKEKWEFQWRCVQSQHSEVILITTLALDWCVITARLRQTPAVDQAQFTANKISFIHEKHSHNWINSLRGKWMQMCVSSSLYKTTFAFILVHCVSGTHLRLESLNASDQEFSLIRSVHTVWEHVICLMCLLL